MEQIAESLQSKDEKRSKMSRSSSQISKSEGENVSLKESSNLNVNPLKIVEMAHSLVY